MRGLCFVFLLFIYSNTFSQNSFLIMISPNNNNCRLDSVNCLMFKTGDKKFSYNLILNDSVWIEVRGRMRISKIRHWNSHENRIVLKHYYHQKHYGEFPKTSFCTYDTGPTYKIEINPMKGYDIEFDYENTNSLASGLKEGHFKYTFSIFAEIFNGEKMNFTISYPTSK
ncbi:MAG: hypothetical protein JWO09_1156 [Bacteroidetes bacterium]|nr:hypothetical protein [Bacteroidota bacterium]